jgi:hypothetical protein
MRLAPLHVRSQECRAKGSAPPKIHRDLHVLPAIKLISSPMETSTVKYCIRGMKYLRLTVAVTDGADSKCPHNGPELQISTVCNSGHSVGEVYTNISNLHKLKPQFLPRCGANESSRGGRKIEDRKHSQR